MKIIHQRETKQNKTKTGKNKGRRKLGRKLNDFVMPLS